MAQKWEMVRLTSNFQQLKTCFRMNSPLVLNRGTWEDILE